MIFQHHRFQVWNFNQHPYRHSAEDIGYSNAALPPGTVTNLKGTLDWIMAVIYPRTKPAVDTFGDLPLVGNTINDYRVVLDDGDGKAASYRWEQREGEASPSWHKIYDMDWGEGSVLASFLNKTQDVYVYRYGHDDVDPDGNPPPADDAGQHIYGGASANTHLHLHANAGDGTGAQTGYIVVYDTIKPYAGLTPDIGTVTDPFDNGIFASSVKIGSLLLTNGGMITDSGGLIDFDDDDLLTTGVSELGGVNIGSNMITSTTSVLGFGATKLESNSWVEFQYVKAIVAASEFKSGTTIGTLTFADGSITDSTGTIDFGNEDLETTGQITCGILFATTADADTGVFGDVRIGFLGDIPGTNVIGTTATSNLDLILEPDGTGTIHANKFLVAYDDFEVTGAITITGLSGFSLTESMLYTASGGFLVNLNNNPLSVNGDIQPVFDATNNLGNLTNRYYDIFLSNSISNGTNAITIASLLSLRDINAGVAAGHTIFWDGTKWVSSAPDTEVDHGSISGLGDDDHTQYVNVYGRAGGQTIYGGTAFGQTLYLAANSINPASSDIIFGSMLRPDLDNTFDIGNSSYYLRDLYMKGEAKGFRVENFANFGSFPLPSGTQIGRLAYDVTAQDLYVDTGGVWKVIGGGGGGGYTNVFVVTTYTASAGERVFATTTSGTFTVDLPATPSIGDMVMVIDNASNFSTDNLTVGRNGENIQGAASDFVMNVSDGWAEFIYSGASRGWEVRI